MSSPCFEMQEVIFMKIPRCMSTQHPDNASVPFFSSSPVLAGEAEVREAFYVYSHLGCDEQMWDVEGKEIDTHVVKKLFTFYDQYFAEHPLGEDVRLTLRVPNPSVEFAEAKILLETLETIPRWFDAARLFYGRDLAPVYEVILPMTTQARELERIAEYYRNFIVARQARKLRDDDITIAEWVGPTQPASIQVIPLFEDLPSMLSAASILESYLCNKEVSDQRVFFAKSDTAMNYGLVAAVLANKIALHEVEQLSSRIGVALHPILGTGSAPFRGGLVPDRVAEVSAEYPSAATFTLQSAFKYDYPYRETCDAIAFLRARKPGTALPVDRSRAEELISRYSPVYRAAVVARANQINSMARYIPARRARKLHVGLFGYARELEGVHLPRAISFTCSLYTLGVPPELLGFEALTQDDLRYLELVHPSFSHKIQSALLYADLESPILPDGLREALLKAGYDWQPDAEYLGLIRKIRSLPQGSDAAIGDLLLRAALRRRFLG
jgi:phosphoenolpyruvate carboxylase